MRAAAEAREPLDGDGEGLLPGDGHVAWRVRRGLLDHQHRARCQGRYLVVNLGGEGIGMKIQTFMYIVHIIRISEKMNCWIREAFIKKKKKNYGKFYNW